MAGFGLGDRGGRRRGGRPGPRPPGRSGERPRVEHRRQGTSGDDSGRSARSAKGRRRGGPVPRSGRASRAETQAERRGAGDEEEMAATQPPVRAAPALAAGVGEQRDDPAAGGSGDQVVLAEAGSRRPSAVARSGSPGSRSSLGGGPAGRRASSQSSPTDPRMPHSRHPQGTPSFVAMDRAMSRASSAGSAAVIARRWSPRIVERAWFCHGNPVGAPGELDLPAGRFTGIPHFP